MSPYNKDGKVRAYKYLSPLSVFRKIPKFNKNQSVLSVLPYNKFGINNDIPMNQGISRNYCGDGIQCGSFPLSVEQVHPFTKFGFKR
jgi:hypothetical protein